MGRVELEDPRENTDLFRRLPDHAKEEFRARWRGRSDADLRRKKRRQDTYVKYAIEGLLLFVITEFVFLSIDLGRTLFLVLPGAALGLVCAHLQASRFVYTILAAVAYVLVYGVVGLFALWHFVVFLCIAHGIGLMHELQRADGTEPL